MSLLYSDRSNAPGRPRCGWCALLVLAVLAAWAAAPTHAFGETGSAASEHRLNPHFAATQWYRVLTLRDYNTRVVLASTALLGVAAGMVGTFTLLRGRALVGDVVSHASLPGIAVAFLLLQTITPGAGRHPVGLLGGAALSGLLGVACTTAITRWSRLKEDAALAIVLSVFFGAGIALLTILQRLPTGHQAGLTHFIYGKAALATAEDVLFTAAAAGCVLLVGVLLFKELALLCFDEQFAAAEGFPTLLIDGLLMALVVAVTVIGLQSVGLLLVVALLIVPAAAARFWTNRLGYMACLAAVFGGTSAVVGVLASGMVPRLATGPTIVLVGAGLFLLSLFAGPARGVAWRWLANWAMVQRMGRQHLLRALFEALEADRGEAAIASAQTAAQYEISRDVLQAARGWTPRRLNRLIRRAIRAGLVTPGPTGGLMLTQAGFEEARRVVRNHRLWELYLIRYAQIAPSHVDRDADEIEHVLEPELVRELEEALAEGAAMPASPHVLQPVASAGFPAAHSPAEDG